MKRPMTEAECKAVLARKPPATVTEANASLVSAARMYHCMRPVWVSWYTLREWGVPLRECWESTEKQRTASQRREKDRRKRAGFKQ